MSEYLRTRIIDLVGDEGCGVRITAQGGVVSFQEWESDELSLEKMAVSDVLARRIAWEILAITEGHGDE